MSHIVHKPNEKIVTGVKMIPGDKVRRRKKLTAKEKKIYDLFQD